jgi:hypothetical protein
MIASVGQLIVQERCSKQDAVVRPFILTSRDVAIVPVECLRRRPNDS